VRSHSTVVEPPGCQEHTTTCGWSRLAAAWRTWPRHGRPGTPGGEEFPYSVKRPPKTYVRSGANLGARRHPPACTYPYSLGRCASGTAPPDHLSDDVGRMVANYRSEGWTATKRGLPSCRRRTTQLVRLQGDHEQRGRADWLTAATSSHFFRRLRILGYELHERSPAPDGRT
jgi:hypothetical protein